MSLRDYLFHEEARVTLYCGDSVEILPLLACPNTSECLEACDGRCSGVDAVVTDPPYGLEFMGKEWDKLTTRNYAGITPGNDSPHARRHSVNFVGSNSPTCRHCGGLRSLATEGSGGRTKCRCVQPDFPEYRLPALRAMQAWHLAWAREALRVLKPGGHLLAFGGTRTHHRLTCALEDAGFEIRDCLMWIYGSGFPKSLDVSKAIDKAAGAERAPDPAAPTVRRIRPGADQNKDGSWEKLANRFYTATTREPASEAARPWSGWGTALKPAWEPIILARKPLAERTVAANVLKHGTGALNVDACRIGTDEHLQGSTVRSDIRGGRFAAGHRPNPGDIPDYQRHSAGRWPANVVLDEEAAAMLDEQSGRLTSGTGAVKKATGAGWQANAYGKESRPIGTPNVEYGDTGGASRFFYTAKADAEDRDGSRHPTVKPVDLCKWLVRLVTPPGGLVLDPFCGSGPIIWAARELGFRAVGIDREAEYVQDAIRRLRQGVLAV